jgi:hypothetical protein
MKRSRTAPTRTAPRQPDMVMLNPSHAASSSVTLTLTRQLYLHRCCSVHCGGRATSGSSSTSTESIYHATSSLEKSALGFGTRAEDVRHCCSRRGVIACDKIKEEQHRKTQRTTRRRVRTAPKTSPDTCPAGWPSRWRRSSISAREASAPARSAGTSAAPTAAAGVRRRSRGRVVVVVVVLVVGRSRRRRRRRRRVAGPPQSPPSCCCCRPRRHQESRCHRQSTRTGRLHPHSARRRGRASPPPPRTAGAPGGSGSARCTRPSTGGSCAHAHTKGRMDGWVDGWTVEWLGGWVGG